MKQQEEWKQALSRNQEYNLKKLFDEIDTQKTNYLDPYNIKRFLVRCSYLPNDNILIAIIRRMDLDSDAKLNFLEFNEALRP